jgi:hypothetical protein
MQFKLVLVVVLHQMIRVLLVQMELILEFMPQEHLHSQAFGQLAVVVVDGRVVVALVVLVAVGVMAPLAVVD